MKFIKRFDVKKRISKNIEGVLYLKDGVAVISIPTPQSTKKLVDIGLTEDGIGIVLKDVKNEPSKAGYYRIKKQIDKNDLPVELRGEGYKYCIPGKEIEKNEFLFKFSSASL